MCWKVLSAVLVCKVTVDARGGKGFAAYDAAVIGLQ